MPSNTPAVSSTALGMKPACMRHALPDCVQEAKEAYGKKRFFDELQHLRGKEPGDQQEITTEETNTVQCYTSSPHLAKQLNKLMRAQNWTALFSNHGAEVKSLASYIAKMEQAYAAKRTLYRGMKMPEQYLRQHYVVGQVVTWVAFSSASSSLQRAVSYAHAIDDPGFFATDGIPCLFIINTHCRGAPVGQTPEEDEVLLAPFVCFEVISIKETTPDTEHNKPLLTINLQSIRVPRSCRLHSPWRPLLFGWQWPWDPEPSELLSELDVDEDEEVERKLDVPGAMHLALLVVILNATFLIVQLFDSASEGFFF